MAHLSLERKLKDAEEGLLLMMKCLTSYIASSSPAFDSTFYAQVAEVTPFEI